MIDTLQLAKDFEHSFDPRQAEALAKAFGQREEPLVTKTDLEIEMTKIRSESNVRFASVDVQFAQVRSEIVEAKSELIRWILGAMVLNAGLVVTLIKVIH